MTLANLMLNIGAHVWFYCSIDGSRREGTIIGVRDDSNGHFARISWVDHGESYVPGEHVFKTEKECNAYINNIAENRKKAFAESIVTLDDLFNFCIEQMYATAYPDYDAIEVAKLKYDEIMERFKSNVKVGTEI